MKGVHTFPESISQKMNVWTWLEFELAYFVGAIQNFSHHATPWQCGSRQFDHNQKS